MILYKYVPSERIDILKNKMIRFTPINEFNDPFEHSMYLTVDRQSLVNHLFDKKLDSIKEFLFIQSPQFKLIEKK